MIWMALSVGRPLASVLKTPVILFFGLCRGGVRYEVHFELFAEEVHRLEHYCRLAADNWFNFYDFLEEQR
jgi:predicted LPLAT superfamily acyltransferase